MKSVLLIGLGRFGKFIAMKLHTMGHQVMAVDTSEERVNALLPYVTNAQIGDSTNEEFLASLGIGNYDSCIVAIGDNFQNSLETAYLLKELGAKKVIANVLWGFAPDKLYHSCMTFMYCFEIGQKIALGKKFING